MSSSSDLLEAFVCPWPAATLPPTPFYVYSEQRLQQLWGAFASSLREDSGAPAAHLHFAVKSNHNPDVLKFLRAQGCGADIVSGGELLIAKGAGFTPDQIVFSGVGKTNAELELAVNESVALINVESRGELERLARTCARLGKIANVALRVNPNVDAQTHPYISTGLKDHKFGVDFDEAWALYTSYARHAQIRLRGISLHIGSQMLNFDALQTAIAKTLDFAQKLHDAGVRLEILDVGGGVGVAYNEPRLAPPFVAYGALVKQTAAKWRAARGEGAHLYSECGRALVAQAGWLVTRVIGTKSGVTKNFAIVDASMTELLRPALYGAQHPIEFWLRGSAESRPTAGPDLTYEVVGPVCESSDVLSPASPLPPLNDEDILAIGMSGAYGITMASTYNARPLPNEWWVPLRGEPRLSRSW